MDRPVFQPHHFAMRAEFAGGGDPKGREMMLIGRKSRTWVETRAAGAGGNIEIGLRGMRPRILHAARHLDDATLRERGISEIDLEMGELVADGRIKRRAWGLRERTARRQHGAGEHDGKAAAA